MWAWGCGYFMGLAPGKACAHPPCSLMYPDLASPQALAAVPCWQPVPPALGDVYVCAGLSQCLPPSPSSVCLSKSSPPFSPTHNPCQAGPPFPWLQTQGQSAIPSCMPPWKRSNNISPSSVGVWRLHSHIPWSHPMAGTLSQCHMQGAGREL